MVIAKIASYLTRQLLVEDPFHDHVRLQLQGGESARSSYVGRVSDAQVEHHLVVVKSLYIFQVISKGRRENKFVFQIISICWKEREQTEPFPLVSGGNSPLLLVLGRFTAFKKLGYLNLCIFHPKIFDEKIKDSKCFDPKDPNIERKEHRLQNAFIQKATRVSTYLTYLPPKNFPNALPKKIT